MGKSCTNYKCAQFLCSNYYRIIDRSDNVNKYLKEYGFIFIFIFLGCFSSLKIPMLTIETGYLGIEFTLARAAIAVPLFIGIGHLMDYYLKGKDFQVTDPTEAN
ncbi:MAG: hypothetical protein KO464_06260 [Candidatus Methanofastidiosum sp.]|nr:hypothetical protein [Methanofastidiosum sp.]